jgi:hypothetical protein
LKFIYVGNYLTISREGKREFLVLLGSFQNFRVTNQKIVLNDNSLILEFEKNSDIDFAKEAIEKFFINEENITIKIVSQIVQDANQVILTFEDNVQKKVKL